MDPEVRDAVQQITLEVIDGVRAPDSEVNLVAAAGDRLDVRMMVHRNAGMNVVVVVVTASEPDSTFLDRAELRRRFGLTERECQVALLLAERRTNKEIARALRVTTHTAGRHTENVLMKLGISSRRDVHVRIVHPRALDACPAAA
jgi:DNA-binding CsgD family transcriptional regulator